ncbi:MAG: hypothetical protein QOC72_2994 [Methylobacteriaceae bacterium]|nr:hypothetical protein [Methylobacteriaceae bacterium]
MLRWMAVATSVCVSGCAIHPLPEDVTFLNTNAIVSHIRCEARTGLKHATTAFLLNPKLPLPATTRLVAEDLANGRISYADFDPKKLDPFTSYYLQKYDNAAIAYDFTFDISEDNSAGANLDFLRTITHKTIGLAVTATNDRQRQTIRNFRVTDTFGALRKTRFCDDEVPTGGNYIYPVAGTIGLDELIKTFIDLNEFNNLAGPDKKETVPVLADTFSFLTMFGGSVTPSVTLAPVTSRFHLASASVPLGASRKDMHKVIIALSLDPKTIRGLVFRPAGVLGLSPTYVGSGKTPAEERALVEIDNQKTINSLNNIALRPAGL